MGVLERKIVEEAKAEILAAMGGVADQKTVDDVKSIVEGLETKLSGSLTANVVKSVQRGVITIGKSSSSGTATINAVNTNKSLVVFNGWHIDSNWSYGGHQMPKLTLTDSTTVTASMGGSTSTSNTVKVAYEVIEYY